MVDIRGTVNSVGAGCIEIFLGTKGYLSLPNHPISQ